MRWTHSSCLSHAKIAWLAGPKKPHHLPMRSKSAAFGKQVTTSPFHPFRLGPHRASHRHAEQCFPVRSALAAGTWGVRRSHWQGTHSMGDSLIRPSWNRGGRGCVRRTGWRVALCRPLAQRGRAIGRLAAGRRRAGLDATRLRHGQEAWGLSMAWWVTTGYDIRLSQAGEGGRRGIGHTPRRGFGAQGSHALTFPPNFPGCELLAYLRLSETSGDCHERDA